VSDTSHVARGRDPSLMLRVSAVLVVLLATVAGGAWWVAADNRAQTECGLTPPGFPSHLRGGGVHADWEWWPPGHVCVHTDDQGRVLARRRL
jgi:hypothetical protein